MVPWERQDPDSEYISPRRPPLVRLLTWPSSLTPAKFWAFTVPVARARRPSCPPRQPNKRSLGTPVPAWPASPLSLSHPFSLSLSLSPARDPSFSTLARGGGKLRRKFREPVVHRSTGSQQHTRGNDFFGTRREESLIYRKICLRFPGFDVDLSLERTSNSRSIKRVFFFFFFILEKSVRRVILSSTVRGSLLVSLAIAQLFLSPRTRASRPAR